jgi:hypothetical protein
MSDVSSNPGAPPPSVDADSHTPSLIHVLVLAIAFGSLAALIYLNLMPAKDAVQYYASVTQYSHPSDSLPGKDPLESLRTSFDKRLEQYKSNLAELRSNLFYQLLFMVVSVVVVISRIESFSIPVINQNVRADLVYLCLPICTLFLWARFGYLLNELIDQRVALWRIAEVLEPSIEAEKTRNPELWRKLLYTYSIRPQLHDGSYLNGWFIIFRETFCFNVPKDFIELTVVKVLMVCFGLYLGVGHGCALGVIWRGSARFSNGSRAKKILYGSYLWGATGLLVLTHYAFHHSGNRNWLHYWILLSGFLVTCGFAGYPWFRKNVARAGVPGHLGFQG